MIDLDDAYRQLAHAWTENELAARYRTTERRGARLGKSPRTDFDSALPTVATALPPAATLGVAVYVLHMLREGAQADLAQRLVGTAQQQAASALHRCHRALKLDGAVHSYTADEWLPTIHGIAAQLLQSAHLNEEPPTIVQAAQETISWLSRVVIELDQDSSETPNSLSETLGRLLTVWVFADIASSG